MQDKQNKSPEAPESMDQQVDVETVTDIEGEVVSPLAGLILPSRYSVSADS